MPIDFDSLTAAGAMMGSGGLVVVDEDTCMVDLARYFLNFTRSESCGQCTPCRLGITQMYSILEDITQGRGRPEDISLLEELALGVKKAPCAAWGRRRRTRCLPPCATSGMSTKLTFWRAAARPWSARTSFSTASIRRSASAASAASRSAPWGR